MADTLTTFLSLVKQTIGGNRNTWGNILNANMDLLDSGIAGRHAVSTTGGSTTLSDTEWIKRIIDVTGTLGSNATIVFPNQSGFWLIRNGTTGAYTLSCKTSGGSAITITQGGWQMVWCDGSDVMRKSGSSYFFDTQMQLPDGTISAPGLAFLAETTLGARRAGYASGTLGSGPFATTNGSPTVTVTHTAHGLTTADYASFSGAAAVAGITIDGLYAVTVVNANSYTITHSANANATTTGGGAGVTYKYMIAAASGGAIALTKGSADIAHVSPYGIILTGSLYVTGAFRVAGNAILSGTLSLAGALSAAAATFTGLITGATATLTGLLTLSSTSHMSMAGGTTAQRPGGPVAKDFRINSDTGFIEVYANGAWNIFESSKSPRGSIDGCTLSNGTDTTNDIDIAAGVCRDSTDTVDIVIATALGKQLDANWTAGGTTGTPAGMRNSAAGIANGTYHLWAVRTAASSAGDVYAHTSAVAATVLAALQAETGGASYAYLRLIGSIIRSTTILQFHQYRDEFWLNTPVLDINNATPGTSANTGTLTVPVGVKVKAFLNVRQGNGNALYLSSLDATDMAASTTVAPLSSTEAGGAISSAAQASVWTSTSATVRYRANANIAVAAATLGWAHPRGKDL